ncbi:MAG TPA: BlaI/MecI/CopY family transcriptional regulator [Lentimicrobium sp.]|nr:BlaI/MecI/CopY family transcriptional regulator [Lentimicrobium sp.]
MKELTKAEEQVMQILWKIKKGFVTEFLDYFPEPKPAYNTVSTIIRILEKKGFIDHEPSGKSYIYFPIVSKTDYSRHSLHQLVKGYFSNSYKQMVSFFSDDEQLSVSELEEIKRLIDKQIKNKQNRDD